MNDPQQPTPSQSQSGHMIPPHAGSQAPQIRPPQAPQTQAEQPFHGATASGGPLGAPATSGNPLGRIALIVAAITLGIDLILTPVAQFIIMSGGYYFAGPIALLSGLITFAGAATALVIGIIALRRPAPHALAGIAVGISAVLIANVLVGSFMSLLYGLF